MRSIVLLFVKASLQLGYLVPEQLPSVNEVHSGEEPYAYPSGSSPTGGDEEIPEHLNQPTFSPEEPPAYPQEQPYPLANSPEPVGYSVPEPLPAPSMPEVAEPYHSSPLEVYHSEPQPSTDSLQLLPEVTYPQPAPSQPYRRRKCHKRKPHQVALLPEVNGNLVSYFRSNVS
jgi:hypothetical protein